MRDRYARLFERLGPGRAALIPFVTLGDPDLATSRERLRLLVASGADALELGLPFSDPVADGPVLQAAATRALASGTRIDQCLELVREVRTDHPDLPIGLLAYANTVVHRGLDAFYGAVSGAGADSVLVADVPLGEAAPFERAAEGAGVATVFIAPPNASRETLAAVAQRSRGYTYVTSRRGVTGAHAGADRTLAVRLNELRTRGAPPGVVGFGIASADDVRSARRVGAAGVIVGSALVERFARGDEVETWLRELATAASGHDEPVTAQD